MAKRKQPVSDVLDLIVDFGNQSAGDKTAHLGISVSRSRLSIAKAEKHFCEKRLACCLIMSADGAHPDQGALDGMEPEDVELEAVFDVKAIRFTADDISFGLTGALGSLDVGLLAKFAKKTGRLMVTSVSEIPDTKPSVAAGKAHLDGKQAAAGEDDDDEEEGGKV